MTTRYNAPRVRVRFAHEPRNPGRDVRTSVPAVAGCGSARVVRVRKPFIRAFFYFTFFGGRGARSCFSYCLAGARGLALSLLFDRVRVASVASYVARPLQRKRVRCTVEYSTRVDHTLPVPAVPPSRPPTPGKRYASSPKIGIIRAHRLGRRRIQRSRGHQRAPCWQDDWWLGECGDSDGGARRCPHPGPPSVWGRGTRR